MSRRVEDILRDKLLDGAPENDSQDWDRLRDSLLEADRKDRRNRYVYIFLKSGRYAAIVIIMVALALLTGKLNIKESNEKVAETIGETVDIIVGSGAKTTVREQTATEGDNRDLFTQNIIEPGNGDQLAEDFSYFSSGMDPITDELADISDYDKNLGVFTVHVPDIPVLSDPYPAGIDETGLYDIEEYLREFQEKYLQEAEESEKGWKLSIAADALSVTNDPRLQNHYPKPLTATGLRDIIRNMDVNGYGSRMASENDYMLMCDGGWYDYQIYNKLEHDLPVSVVLNLNRSIGKRWGAGTGLVYTFLGTSGVDLTPENPVYLEQSVQYLGLPLFLYYSLLPERSGWFIDLKAGFTANKPISVKGTQITWVDGIKESEPVHYLMIRDVMISYDIGISFGRTIIGNIKIFAEPSFSDNIHFMYQPLTFISERPASFNLQAGFRYDF